MATLFDAQMIAVEPFSVTALASRSEAIKLGMLKLFADEEFAHAIASQTNTPRFVRTRISMVAEMVQEAVASA
ncbi:hypothetical protein [Arthrobacter sp. 2MCAF14]|uniref:hypothetical protein n=1 Tax=Arthrobacter sp. 2MCAF14 TaxID=3232982 RepID=UPI003F93C283